MPLISRLIELRTRPRQRASQPARRAGCNGQAARALAAGTATTTDVHSPLCGASLPRCGEIVRRRCAELCAPACALVQPAEADAASTARAAHVGMPCEFADHPPVLAPGAQLHQPVLLAVQQPHQLHPPPPQAARPCAQPLPSCAGFSSLPSSPLAQQLLHAPAAGERWFPAMDMVQHPPSSPLPLHGLVPSPPASPLASLLWPLATAFAATRDGGLLSSLPHSPPGPQEQRPPQPVRLLGERAAAHFGGVCGGLRNDFAQCPPAHPRAPSPGVKLNRSTHILALAGRDSTPAGVEHTCGPAPSAPGTRGSPRPKLSLTVPGDAETQGQG